MSARVRHRTYQPGFYGVRGGAIRRTLDTTPSVATEADSTPRNGLPVRFYTYGGTGFDTLTAWMDDEPDEEIPRLIGRPAMQPCGTPAAARRHRRHKEKLCAECLKAERAASRERLNGSDSTFNTRRREAYRAARETGMTPREANGYRRAS